MKRAQARSESVNSGDDREPELEERTQSETEHVPPEEEIPLLQQLVRTTNVPPVPPPPPPFVSQPQLSVTSHQNLLEKIRKYGVEELKEKTEDDPVEAEEWVKNSQQIFEELQCSEDEKLKCVVSLLKGEAYQ
ncbi:Type-2 restriction enzyme NgoMIV [Gossypium australe]|uniref:Type-2 restriction enzyme NgoMIV n=1 Tax=Gossypium australe TaxID=47621 RepID=A0A5B6W7C0_9ROSI|nr:Type-2 restriction enzyme NgoMIV [Gossypium australe]